MPEKSSTFSTLYASLVFLSSRSLTHSILRFSVLRPLLGFVLGSIGVLIALVGLGVSAGTSVLAQDPKGNRTSTRASDSGSKIAPEVLAETADGRSASVVIFLADQADVSAA